MEVFKQVEEIDIEGHKLEIHLANFIEAEKLFSEVLKCYQDGIEGATLLTIDSVKLALTPCLKKSFFDKEEINGSFFEDVNKRQYYMPICLKVLEVNIAPFMTNPS